MAILTRPGDRSDQIIDALSQTPAVKDALASQHTRSVATRADLRRELAELEKAATKELPKLSKAVDSAIEGQRRAEVALLEAKRAVDRAVSARSNFSFSYDRQADVLNGLLRAGADNASIDAFVSWANKAIDEARRAPIAIDVQTTTSQVTKAKITTASTNKPSILARIDALRSAIEKAEAMRLESDQSNVTGALAALKAALPAISTSTTTTEQQPDAA